MARLTSEKSYVRNSFLVRRLENEREDEHEDEKENGASLIEESRVTSLG